MTPPSGDRPGRRASIRVRLALILLVWGPLLAAGRQAPGSLRLDVPLVWQEKDLCGAASLAMVFEYWGRDISQYAIADALGHEPGEGLSGRDLRDFCERAGFSAFLFQGEIDLVKDHLRKGRPVVVAIRPKSARLYHYIVLVGFDDGASVILANDPQSGKIARYPTREFLRLWGRSRSWSLLIVPKQGPASGPAQVPADALDQGRSLYDSGDLAGAERLFRESLARGPETAELHHLIGMCAALQGRLADAERELLAAIRIDPSFVDSRIEIGGLYFKQKRYEESERALRRALELRPEDAYARDLLGTVYFVNGSLEKALAEWNKIDRPVLDELAISGEGIAHPELLRKELCFRPGQLVRPSGIRESRLRLDKVDSFSGVSFSLRPDPASQDRADLLVSGREEKGFGPSPAAVAVSGLRDIAHSTVYLDYKNIAHRGVGLHAAYRWDPYQKMGAFSVQAPHLLGTPFYYRLGYREIRDRWLFEGAAGASEDAEFTESGREVRLDMDHILNDRVRLDHHLRISRTDFQPISGSVPEDTGTRVIWGGDYTFRLAGRPGPAPTAALSFHYDLAGPGGGDRKGFARSVLTAEIIKPWGPELSGAAAARLTGRISWGLASAATPFEEYFVLGIGPDVEYLLRAYRSSAEGKMGSSPLGREFLLMNIDYLHGLGRLAFVRIEGGVFFDAAKVAGPPPVLPVPPSAWLSDLGVCLAARIFQVTLRLSYAHGLADGRQALYLSAILE